MESVSRASFVGDRGMSSKKKLPSKQDPYLVDDSSQLVSPQLVLEEP